MIGNNIYKLKTKTNFSLEKWTRLFIIAKIIY